MDDHDKCSYSCEMCSPREHHKSNSGIVMNEHFPEILSLDVEELADGKRPVKGKFQHVVPPDIIIHLMEGVVVPTVSDVPQPCLIPKTVGAIHQDKGVERTPERNKVK